MPTKKDLRVLAQTRLMEAEALFSTQHYSGAAYLCGYVVELALKARICRLLGTEEYPATGKLKSVFAVHDLEQLLFLAGLEKKLYESKAVFRNWSVAVLWNPEFRYRPLGAFSEYGAQEILDAVRDPTNGVFQWIKKHW